MSVFMTYAEWMKRTDGGMMSVRSGELKAFDKVFAAYEKAAKSEAALAAMKRAWNAWVMKENKAAGNSTGWEKSKRNKHGAVSDLHKQLIGVGGAGVLTTSDREAIAYIKDNARGLIKQLFEDKKIETRPGIIAMYKMESERARQQHQMRARYQAQIADSQLYRGGMGNDEDGPPLETAWESIKRSAARSIEANTPTHLKSGKKAVSYAKIAYKAIMAIRKLIKDATPPEHVSGVTREIASHMPGLIEAFVLEIAPYVGVGKAGYDTVKGVFTTISASQRVSGTQQIVKQLTIDRLSSKDPLQAATGLIVMLDREYKTNLANTTVSAVGLGGKLGGLFLDLGLATTAAIGTATSIAKLAIFVCNYVRDYMDKYIGNKLLALGVFDARIYEECPLLGAYALKYCNTSDVLNGCLDTIGQPGFMSHIEFVNKQYAAPLKKEAIRVVKEHRLWIPELEIHKPDIGTRARSNAILG